MEECSGDQPPLTAGYKVQWLLNACVSMCSVLYVCASTHLFPFSPYLPLPFPHHTSNSLPLFPPLHPSPFSTPHLPLSQVSEPVARLLQLQLLLQPVQDDTTDNQTCHVQGHQGVHQWVGGRWVGVPLGVGVTGWACQWVWASLGGRVSGVLSRTSARGTLQRCLNLSSTCPSLCCR